METTTNTKRKRAGKQGHNSPQVKNEDPISNSGSAATTSETATQFIPKENFLTLLREVGAQGKQSVNGEVFTLKQLGFYLKEYIKTRILYDPCNPSVVHCDKDPLGKVFGCPSFTISDAPKLLLENAKAVNANAHFWTTEDIISGQHEKRELHFSSQMPLSESTTSTNEETCQSKNEKENAIVSSTVPSQQQQTISKPEGCPDIVPGGGEGHHPSASPSSASHSSGSYRASRRTKRARLGSGDLPTTSETPEDGRRSRRRGSSFSIVLPSEGESKSWASPWYLMTVEVAESDKSEVLSVQSKETVFVQDSTDDYWFLDVDDSDGSVAMEQDRILLDFQSAHSFSDPPFAEEYEVDSDNDQSDKGNDQEEDDEDDDSPDEEGFIILCGDSDVEFWADSESSTDGTDDESDNSLAEEDMWSCEQCDTINSPLQRHCARCWTLRPDWVEDDLPASQSRSKRWGAQSLMPRDQVTSSGSEATEKEKLSRRRPYRCRSRPPAVGRGCLQGQWGSTPPLKTNNMAQTLGSPRIRRWRRSRASATANMQSSEHSGEDNCARTRLLSYSEPCLSTPGSFTITSSQVTEPHHLNETPTDSWSPMISTVTDSGLGSSQGSGMFISQSQHPGEQEIELQDSGHFSSLYDVQDIDTPNDKSVNSLHSTPSQSLLENHTSVGCKSAPEIKPTSKASQSDNSPTSERDIQSNSATNASEQVAPSNSNLNQYNDLCMVCYVRRKEASIIHGKTGHQVCCYKCAKKLQRRGKRCPVCRRPIQKVIKNFII